jgi:chaperone protein EcpD
MPRSSFPFVHSRFSPLVSLALLLSVVSPVSEAALTVSTTRVVFQSDKRSASVIVSNPSKKPYAVQTWVNTQADDTTTAVPFVASPPLFRLDPGKEQQVQINGLPGDLPNDRESLFFFNVQEIPQVEADQVNVLNIALRTRLKLFYRPVELKDNPMTRLKDIGFRIVQKHGKSHLVAANPSPFHVTFARLEVIANGKTEKLESPQMLGPLGTREYPLKTPVGAAAQVLFTTINDYGAYTAPLTLPAQLNH